MISETQPGLDSAPPALSVSNLSKTFVGRRVLTRAALHLNEGEIHALLGENGSGKSTLIKCLAGVYPPDPGCCVAVDGHDLEVPYGPETPARNGISFVHQDLGLIDELSVSENLALTRGFDTNRVGGIKWRAEAQRAKLELEPFDDSIDPRAPLGSLSQAQKTLVAIARALSNTDNAHVLVLDEPTAALPEEEVATLFVALRSLAARGVAILYVTHRLAEVFALTQRVTILRDGVLVGTWHTSDLDEKGLVAQLIGRDLDQYFPSELPAVRDNVALRAVSLAGPGVEEATFEIGAGEIVGLAGLLGSGRTELARLLFGATRATRGTIDLYGRRLKIEGPGDAVRAGIGLVPEERRRLGSHAELTVAENLTLADVSPHVRFGRLSRGRERSEASRLLEQFRVSPPDPDRRFATLSGGNQQKVVLAKWMRLRPRLLILDEPTQGVDIGAKADIYQLIDQAAADGTAILLIDSEFDDLCHLCHRILVMRDGRIAAELEGNLATPERLLQVALASGREEREA